MIVALFACAFIFVTGVFSDLYLGDETFHYRFSSQIYQNRARPLYDPLTGYSEQGKIRYVVEPLWHAGLAIVWAITGGSSKITAQLYHVLYYAFFLASTYLLAKEMYDPKRAFYSMLLVGSAPLMVALSVIFHLDMPVTALITFCFLMLVKKKYVWAGLFLGLSFLCKRNMLFLFPVIVGSILLASEEPLKQRVTQLLVLGGVFTLTISPDLYFRVRYFGLPTLWHNVSPQWPIDPIKNFSKTMYPSKFIAYDYNNIINNPILLIRDFGPLLIVCVGIYLFQNARRKRYDKKDRLLLWTALSYIFFCIIFFWPILSLRYFLPIVPFLAILGSGSLVLVKKRWLKNALIFAFIGQFITTSGYTFMQRRIPSSVKQAYQFIRENTPADARIMCTKNALALHTKRVAMWSSYASLAELPYLFWKADEKEALEILGKYKIGYIFVEKDRIYDDRQVSHLGGYPQSFLEKRSTWSSFELVFDNEKVAVWKIVQSPSSSQPIILKRR